MIVYCGVIRNTLVQLWESADFLVGNMAVRYMQLYEYVQGDEYCLEP